VKKIRFPHEIRNVRKPMPVRPDADIFERTTGQHPCDVCEPAYLRAGWTKVPVARFPVPRLNVAVCKSCLDAIHAGFLRPVQPTAEAA